MFENELTKGLFLHLHSNLVMSNGCLSPLSPCSPILSLNAGSVIGVGVDNKNQAHTTRLEKAASVGR